MRHRRLIPNLPSFFFLFMALCAAAQQEDAARVFVRGEVSADRGTAPDDLVVELYDVHSRLLVDKALVGGGNFEFHDLKPDQYTVRVVTLRGEVLRENSVSIHGNDRLSLQVPGLTEPPPAGGIVSANSLRVVPRKAAREFRRSLESSEAGDAGRSLEHLKKAIEIYPDYAEAHNNLGSHYVAARDYDKAQQEFQETIRLSPGEPKGYLNLGVTLAVLGRYEQAEGDVRKALQLDPNSIPAHYELGQVLAAQGKDLPGALQDLRQSEDRFPKARLVIARILVVQGAPSQAAEELREYLKSGDSDNRAQAESWLAKLQSTTLKVPQAFQNLTPRRAAGPQ